MEHPSYDELSVSAQMCVREIAERYNTDTTEVAVGRKAPGDKIQFRLELYSDGSLSKSTSWKEPDAFHQFVNGMTTTWDFERRVHTDP